MFICEECAKQHYVIDSFWFFVGPLSKGPCECCKSVKICLDAPSSSLKTKENSEDKKVEEFPVKFSKEITDFIEANAAYTTEDLPNKWYWFPQYYKKVGEGLFVVTQWKDLPDSLKHIVEQSLPRNPESDASTKVG